ncbi:MAG: c-type cytochrome [Pseudorhodobacter sp.]
MKFASKALIASIVLTAGMAVAKEGVEDPTVKARQDMMGEIARNTKTLGDMAGGKADFDASAAEAAKAALLAAAADIAVKFEPEADDPASEATPAIWEKWDDFTAAAEKLGSGAEAIDVSSLETIQAGMGAIGGACKDCHTDFRAKRQ